jgi:hypothetical protein
MVPKFHGEIGSDGRIHLHEIYQKRFNIYLESFQPKTLVYVTIERAGKNQARSDKQNNYYWGVVIELARNFCGYTKDEMHDAFGMMFRKMEAVDGVPTIRSTSTMSTTEFNQYVEDCKQFAAVELGVYIPDPNEVDTKGGSFL